MASLNDFVDPKFWGSLVEQAFRNPLGTSPDGRAPLTAPTDDPYQRSYDEIISIQQKGSRGFRTIDIDPSQLDRETYYPMLDQDFIAQLVGTEGGQLAEALGEASESTTLPFWRTVGFTLNANWMKIEYLPSGTNDLLSGNTLPDNSAYPYYAFPGLTPWSADANSPFIQNGTPYVSEQYICTTSGTVNFGAGPLTFSIGDVITQNSSTLVWSKTGTAPVDVQVSPYIQVKYASERLLLVNFEDTTTAPIIAKHGDVFEIPFGTVYLTFKTWSPRIRITAGYNAKIQANNNDTENARSMAFGGGHGFLENQALHYVPFSISNENLATNVTSALFLTETITSKIWPLIINTVDPAQPNFNAGVQYGWLTKLSLSSGVFLPAAGTGTSPYFINAELVIADYPSLTIKRRLVQTQVCVSDRDRTSVVNNAIGQEPIRFSLHVNECLILKVTGYPLSLVTQNIVNMFSCEGYTYGNLIGTGLSSDFTPFISGYKTTQAAFPQDRFTTGAPR